MHHYMNSSRTTGRAGMRALSLLLTLLLVLAPAIGAAAEGTDVEPLPFHEDVITEESVVTENETEAPGTVDDSDVLDSSGEVTDSSNVAEAVGTAESVGIIAEPEGHATTGNAESATDKEVAASDEIIEKEEIAEGDERIEDGEVTGGEEPAEESIIEGDEPVEEEVTEGDEMDGTTEESEPSEPENLAHPPVDTLDAITQTSASAAGAQPLVAVLGFAPASIDIETTQTKTIYDAVADAIAESIGEGTKKATVILKDGESYAVGGKGEDGATIALDNAMRQAVGDILNLTDVSKLDFTNLNISIGTKTALDNGDASATSAAKILDGLTLDAGGSKGVSLTLGAVHVSDAQGAAKDIVTRGVESVTVLGTTGEDALRLNATGVKSVHVDTGAGEYDTVDLALAGADAKYGTLDVYVQKESLSQQSSVSLGVQQNSAKNVNITTENFSETVLGGADLPAIGGNKYADMMLGGTLKVTASQSITVNGSIDAGTVSFSTTAALGSSLMVNAGIVATGAIELDNTAGEDGAQSLFTLNAALRGKSISVRSGNVTAKNSMMATGGNLTISGLAGSVTLGNLTAATGSVEVKSAGGSVKTEIVDALQGSIAIEAGGAVETGNLFGKTGVSLLAKTGAVTVTGRIAGTGVVSIDAYGDAEVIGSIAGSNMTLFSRGRFDMGGELTATGDIRGTADTAFTVGGNIKGKSVRIGEVLELGAWTAQNIQISGSVTATSGDVEIISGGSGSENLRIDGAVKGKNISVLSKGGIATLGGDILGTGSVVLQTFGKFDNLKLAITGTDIGISAAQGFSLASGGKLTATKGQLKIGVVNGGITFAQGSAVKAASFDLSAYNTDIRLHEALSATGGEIVLFSNAGNIFIDKALTSKGSIDMKAYAGEIKANALTAGGNVDLLSGENIILSGLVKGKDITIQSTNAGVDLYESITGTGAVDVDVKTGFSVFANTKNTNAISGTALRIASDADLSARIKLTATTAGISLSSASGDVVVGSVLSAKTSIDLSAENGSIYAETALTASGAITAKALRNIDMRGALKGSYIFLESTGGNVRTYNTVTATGAYAADSAEMQDPDFDSRKHGAGVYIQGLYFAGADKSVTSKGSIVLLADGKDGQTYTSVLAGGALNSSVGSVIMESHNAIEAESTVTAKADVSILSTGIDSVGAALESYIRLGGAVKAGGVLTLNAPEVYALGALTGKDVQVTALGLMELAGITSAGMISLMADGNQQITGRIHILGTVKAAGDLLVTAGHLTQNTKGTVLIEGAVSSATGHVKLLAHGDITLLSAVSSAKGMAEAKAVGAGNVKTMAVSGREVVLSAENGLVKAWGALSASYAALQVSAASGIELMDTAKGVGVEISALAGSVIVRKAVTSTASVGIYGDVVDVNAITAKGDVTLRRVDHLNNISLEASTVTLHGAVTGGGTVAIEATGNIVSYGAIKGGIVRLSSYDTNGLNRQGDITTNGGVTSATGEIVLDASGSAYVNAAVSAKTSVFVVGGEGSALVKGALSGGTSFVQVVAGKHVDIRGIVKAATSVELTSFHGDISVNAAVTSVGHAVVIDGAGAVSVSAALSGKLGVTVDAGAGIDLRGAVSSVSGTVKLLAAAGNINAYAALSGLGIDIEAEDGSVWLHNTVASRGKLDIGATQGIETRKNITAVGNIEMLTTGGQLRTLGAVTSSGGTLGLYSHGGLETVGAVTGKEDVMLSSLQTTFLRGMVKSTGGLIAISGRNVDARAALTAASHLSLSGQYDVMTNANLTSTLGRVTVAAKDGTVHVKGGTLKGAEANILSKKGDIVLDGVITTTKAKDAGFGLSVKADAGLIYGSGTLTSAAFVSLTAKGDIGDANTMLKIKHGTEGYLNASSEAGNVYVHSLTRLVVGQVKATDGVASLKATGDIVALKHKSSSTKHIVARDITLSTSTGKIGTEDTVLRATYDTIDVGNAKTVYIIPAPPKP